MTVQHHLDDATLLRYASGDLDEAFSIVVAAHIAMCDTCRAAAHAAEEIGGYLLAEADAAPLESNALDRMMGLLDAEGPDMMPTRQIRVTPKGDVPLPLQHFIGPELDDIRWRKLVPGVRKHTIKLASAPRSSLYMLYIGEGMAMPEHGHGGTEMTLVLSGAYRDDLGRFGPGDIADLDEHVEHQPRVEPGGPCICLVATEAPTRFKGIFSRLLQPLVGI
ncbi:ChrR family anti-sigma-E factor [Mariluticola halotolerans]|uniref:ChrR family anti-sigma-E factor n=1 Tax=Mariluticola halotolerans TaxID=2909283 RepID=UPI0026E3BFA8|nr:ChrR family anti-sigma-E factor [Mariluticola halotolerans]UJQ94329.1 ChrR family anti-sigma-E factor [Mariluticola halotolerans]